MKKSSQNLKKTISGIGYSALAFFSLPAISFGQIQSQIVQCTGAENCNFDTLMKTFNAFINIVIQIAILLFAIILAYAGWTYITAGGDAGKRSKAHSALWTAVKGFIVVLLAYLIIELIFSTLGVKTDANPFN